MKNLLYFFIGISLPFLMLNCEKSKGIEEEKSLNEGIQKEEKEFSFEDYSQEEQLKITITESLNNLFKKDVSFAKEFVRENLLSGNKTIEFVYSKEKNKPTNKSVAGKNYRNFEDMLIENILIPETTNGRGVPTLRMQKEKLLRNADNILPNLVIKIPDWVNPIFEVFHPDELNYEVVGVKTMYKTSSKGSKSVASPLDVMFLSEEIPIQVKESEKLIPLEKESYRTIWGDDFIEDHFPSLRNYDTFNRNDYIVFSDSKYDYIDKMKLNKDLMSGNIYGISLEPQRVHTARNSNCKKIYERDCVREKNVIEGFKMANNSVFVGINNQPGGEDVITLHYIFVTSKMCGNLNTSQDCSPDHWKFVFMGNVNDFYTIQVHRGYPRAHEMKDVIYQNRSRRFYVKSFPKYYNIPVDFSAETIYSQASYLIRTAGSTWDGNVYGDNVSFSIYEHDDIVVSASNKKTITVNNTTKVSAKLKLGEIFEGGADFDNGVVRTSEYSYTIDASKDVELGENTCNYADKNYYRNGKLYGINKSTGSVITHFAFYY